MLERARYLLWAMMQLPFDDRSCPSCGGHDTLRVRRKAVVTALYQCKNCHLLFRVPRDTAAKNRSFYQRRYTQGFTTDCPDDATLAHLMQSGFQGSNKDYRPYLQIMRDAGVMPGLTVLDYGASWGYGTWQLMQAGYRVVGYEISQPRARYAAEKLGCQMLPAPTSIPNKVDCLFSAHVIEHLPDPSILWSIADQVLTDAGIVILFTPNGNPAREQQPGSHYHQLWGQVHPFLLSAESLTKLAQRHGFVGAAYSSPYQPTEVQSRIGGQVLGDELLFVAWRSAFAMAKHHAGSV
jgi:2-polyprenyl-3-methyl-5-hydroxy-6-metoxy-1,4-benzoquinol methylase